jgi:hypothetical protein
MLDAREHLRNSVNKLMTGVCSSNVLEPKGRLRVICPQGKPKLFRILAGG